MGTGLSISQISLQWQDNSSGESGFKIAKNITLRIKPFLYGKKLTDYHPVKSKMQDACPSETVGILANGSVVPCYMAYGELLSMGNIHEESLGTILERNAPFLKDIRAGVNLPSCCQRCLGAPTGRGALLRKFKKGIQGCLYRPTGTALKAPQRKSVPFPEVPGSG